MNERGRGEKYTRSLVANNKLSIFSRLSNREKNAAQFSVTLARSPELPESMEFLEIFPSIEKIILLSRR